MKCCFVRERKKFSVLGARPSQTRVCIQPGIRGRQRVPLWTGQCVQPVKSPSSRTLKLQKHIRNKKKAQIFATIQKSSFPLIFPRNSTLVGFLQPLVVFFSFSFPFLLVRLSQLLQIYLLGCCSFAQTYCPDLIAANNRDPTYISASALPSLYLHQFFTSPQSDIYMCLSDISYLELFCFLVMQEPISSSKHLLQNIQTYLHLL